MIICDGCNDSIKDPEVFLLCEDDGDQRMIVRCECAKCVKKYFGDLSVIDETKANLVEKVINILTPREKNFVMNFFISKTDDKKADQMNYLHDLMLYGYTHANYLAFLFNYFYNSLELVLSLEKSTA